MPDLDQFRKDIEKTINIHCIDNMCETPDFILADYVLTMLTTLSHTVADREKWFGREPRDRSVPQYIGEL